MANPVRMLFKQDTVIKQSAIDSNLLTNDQKQNVPVGTLLVLQAYSDPAQSSNHYKFTLSNLQIKGYNTWYAFAPHVRILQESLTTVQSVSDLVAKQTEKNVAKIYVGVVPTTQQTSFLKLALNVDTIIKRSPVDSQLLADQSKQTVPAGTQLVLLHNRADASNLVNFPIQDGHIKVSFKDLQFKGHSQDWFVFAKHVGIITNS
jgi:hypothetical protein